MVESHAQSKCLDLGNAPFADTEELQAKIHLSSLEAEKLSNFTFEESWLVFDNSAGGN